MIIQKTEVKLLDCPFCGQVDNNDSIRMEDDSLSGLHGRLVHGYFWIECHACGVRGPETRSQEDAIQSWNRVPQHYAGEELAHCDKCGGTGQWFKSLETFCENHRMWGHTSGSPMCEKIREEDMQQPEI